LEKQNKKETITNQALGGSVWNTATAIIQRIGGLVFTIIIARLLLPEGFGAYNLAISVGLIFFMISQTGIDRALIVYFSGAIEKNEKKARAYFRYTFGLKMKLLLSMLALLIVLSYPIALYVLKKPDMFMPIFLVSFYMLFLSLDQYLSAFFFSIKKVKYVAVRETIFQTVKIILSILLLAVVIDNPTPSEALIILLASSFSAIVYSFYRINKMYPRIFFTKERIDKSEKKKIFSFASYLTFTAITTVLIGNIDTVALGVILKDTTYIGIYQAAFVLMSSISGLLGFGQVLLPIFVEVREKRLEDVFNKAFRYSMMLALPASFGLAVLGGHFLVLIYGYSYVEGALPLYFLSMFIFLAAQVGLLVELFSSREKSKEYFPLIIGTLIIDLILNYVFIKYLSYYSDLWAITGAAIATTLSWLIYCVGMIIVARRKLGIKIDLSLTIKPLIASLIMAAFVYFAKVALVDINVWKGGLLIILGAFVYFVALYIIGGIRKADYYIANIIVNRVIGFLRLNKA